MEKFRIRVNTLNLKYNFILIKTLFFFLFTLVFAKPSEAQVTVDFQLTADAGNQGLSGNIRLCNNSGGPLPAGYSISFRWPSLNGFDWGPTAVRNGTGLCDSWTLSFQSWQLPANGACANISSGKTTGAYTAPLRYPAYGIDQFGDTALVVVTNSIYIPKSYNQNNWQYSFDPNCFIPSPTTLCLGEAQLREWNALWDVRVPQNRKNWALASAHISTLFNNMVGAPVVSMNYAFAQSMIEGRMGCDIGFTPPAGDNNPLSYNAGSVSSGCFQILAPGWAQIQQFYPSLTAPLNYNNIIPGNHYVTAALSKALYDMTTFAKYEKINCANPIGFFVGSADQYAAEEILAYAYHEGPNGSEGALLNILKTNRATTINNNNIAKHLQQNFANGSTQYSERMRNNLIQLENNFAIPGGNSALSIEAQTNWVGGSPPTGYEWHGCYNQSFTWAEISSYIDEAATLFWTANVPLVKSNAQTAFNAINGGAPVNFSNLGTVIDAIVLAFPAYSPDEGIGEIYFASACGSPSVTLSTCDEICPPAVGELWVHLMGTAPFSYTIVGPGGITITRTNVTKATDKITVPQPGSYRVSQIQDANGNVYLNCNSTSAIIQQPVGCTPLPLSLLDFRIKDITTHSIGLEWITLKEKDLKDIIVERRINANNFEPIGNLTPSEKYQSENNYSFVDYKPSKSRNEYRIGFINMDGSKSYSKILSASILFQEKIVIIPNPNRGQFTMLLSEQELSEEKNILILDINGKEIRNINTSAISVSVDNIQAGVYLIKATNREKTLIEKLVVVD